MIAPAVLIIAASDSSGGAGILRDVRVLADFSIDALCVVTAVTAQSNSRVVAVHPVPPQMIWAQANAAFETRRAAAIKIGALATQAIVEAVAASIPPDIVIPIVLDPVLQSSSGGVLLDEDGRQAMLKCLLPRATLLTPNVPEAAALLDEEVATSERELIEQAQRLLALGPKAVLLKGGHRSGEAAIDLLVSGSYGLQRLGSARIAAVRRGTGCALASAIAAGLASGVSLFEACGQAKRYVLEMLRGR